MPVQGDPELDEIVRLAVGNEDAVSYTELLCLGRRLAMMLKDGEQTEERKAIGLPPFQVMPGAAMATLQDLIADARHITGDCPAGLIEPD